LPFQAQAVILRFKTKLKQEVKMARVATKQELLIAENGQLEKLRALISSMSAGEQNENEVRAAAGADL
jgi:hypothetical protein